MTRFLALFAALLVWTVFVIADNTLGITKSGKWEKGLREDMRQTLAIEVAAAYKKPCGYCWQHECDLPGMECAKQHEPEGGFSPFPHEECLRMVETL